MLIENFISNWNSEFPNHELKVANLKEPQALISALIQLLSRLGINHSIFSELPEENINESVPYYRDLLPVINMTRIVNHLFSILPELTVNTISILHFLQPSVVSSHSILLLLFNLMTFNEDTLRDIAPHEEEIFSKTEQVRLVSEQKHKLQELLNEQAQDIGKRAERVEKVGQEIKLLEEEVKQHSDVCSEKSRELDAILKEARQLEMVRDQKKAQGEAFMSEVARNKALRVYDAEDVKAQIEQATRNMQETEEMCNAPRVTLMQKEDCLKNLLTIKPNLDTANNLLHEIDKLFDSLAEVECGDLDSDSKEGELDVLETELEELLANARELIAALQETRARNTDAAAKRQHDRATQLSVLREASERDRENSERCLKAAQKTKQIKELTLKYKEEKSRNSEEIETISNNFRQELSSTEETLIATMIHLKALIKEKQWIE